MGYVLTPAVLLGVPPWIVNPVLGVGLLFAFWALAREQMGKGKAAAAHQSRRIGFLRS